MSLEYRINFYLNIRIIIYLLLFIYYYLLNNNYLLLFICLKNL